MNIWNKCNFATVMSKLSFRDVFSLVTCSSKSLAFIKSGIVGADVRAFGDVYG